MAPTTNDEIFADGIADLNERHQRLLRAGVRGAADGDTPGGDAAAETPDDDASSQGGAAPDEGAPVVAEGETAQVVEGDAPVVEGTAPEGAEAEASAPPVDVPNIPEDLASASGEDLSTLWAQYGAAREALLTGAKSADDLVAIEELTGRRESIRAELQRRIDSDAKFTADLSTLQESLADEGALPEPAVAVASATPPAPSSRAIAQARGTQAPAAQAPAPVVRTAPMLAALSQTDVQVGAEMSMMQLGSALDQAKGNNHKTIVASFKPYEEDGTDKSIMLGRHNGAGINTEVMLQAQDEWWKRIKGESVPARAAAICGPYDILRNIPDAFSTAEPVRDIFPSRPAGRLAFQFIVSESLATIMPATAIWDEDDQAAVDPDDSDTWKACLPIDCKDPVDIVAEAVFACITYDITTEMSAPERLQNVMNALRAARARRKEAQILDKIDALSSHYNYYGAYGAVPTLIAALNTAIAQATYTNRLEEEIYSIILPPGVVQLLTIDLAGRAYDTGDVTNALQYVRDRVEGVREVVSSLDAAASGEPGLPFVGLNPPGEPAVDLPDLSALSNGQHRIRVVSPGDALYAETGQLNVGTERDAALIRQNRTMYFEEEFFLLAKNGPSPWFTLDVRLCADGGRGGLYDPVGCSS